MLFKTSGQIPYQNVLQVVLIKRIWFLQIRVSAPGVVSAEKTFWGQTFSGASTWEDFTPLELNPTQILLLLVSGDIQSS